MGRKSIREHLTEWTKGVNYLNKSIEPSWRLIHDIVNDRWDLIGIQVTPDMDIKTRIAVISEQMRLKQWAVEKTINKSMPELKENNIILDEDDINPVVDILKNMQGKKDDQAITAVINTSGTAT